MLFMIDEIAPCLTKEEILQEPIVCDFINNIWHDRYDVATLEFSTLNSSHIRYLFIS